MSFIRGFGFLKCLMLLFVTNKLMGSGMEEEGNYQSDGDVECYKKPRDITNKFYAEFKEV